MIYGLYQSAAGMMTHEYRQGVLANNLANADTAGFKRDVATSAERRRADVAGVRDGASDELLATMTGGVWLGRTRTDFAEGSFKRTDQPLDVALSGPGFLRVSVDGRELLTRDGRMTLTPDGLLVSAIDGAPLLGESGAPIRLDPRHGLADVQIDERGTVLQGGAVRGRLGVVDVENCDALRKEGGARFSAAGTAPVPSGARVLPGYIEQSGVEPVREMVSIMEAARAYQINAQMLTLQDQSAARLINVVGS